MKPLRVLIAGGSYGGLAVATNLLDLCESRLTRFSAAIAPVTSQVLLEVTIVDERDGYYHLIGSPLALAQKEYSSKAWVRFEDIPSLQHRSIEILHGSITEINRVTQTATFLDHHTETHRNLEYDYFVAATGLRRQWPSVPQSLQRSGYLEETGAHIKQLEAASSGVVVIGGGAVGIEIAAELKMVQPRTRVTLIHSRDKLLSSEPLPDELKEKTVNLLRETGVEVVLGKRVIDRSTSTFNGDEIVDLLLSDQTTIRASHIIDAVSKPVPSTSYLPKDVLDAGKFVKISSTLNFDSSTPNFAHHFAVGDIAAWTGIKRCGAAMHMGLFAANNIYQHALSRNNKHFVPEYKALSEHPPMIGLAIGHKAISYSPTDGIRSGEAVLQQMFAQDLGWSICWNYLQLGNPPAAPVTTLSSGLNDELDGAVTGGVKEELTRSISRVSMTELPAVEQVV